MVCLNCAVISSMVLFLVSGTEAQIFLSLLMLMFLFYFCLQNKTCLDGLSELRGDLVDGLVIGFQHR